MQTIYVQRNHWNTVREAIANAADVLIIEDGAGYASELERIMVAATKVTNASAHPLPWRVVKPLLRATLGTALLAAGFPNPGVRMWRYRPHFIDVVEARLLDQRRWTIDLGCAPRLPGVSPRMARSCLFHTMIPSVLDSALRPPLGGWPIASTVADQERQLAALTPALVSGIERWFAQFRSVADVRQALAHPPATTAPPTTAPPSSPHYHHVLRLLTKLDQQIKTTQRLGADLAAASRADSAARFAPGMRVRVRLNARNRTLREGLVAAVAWHVKDGQYYYWLVDTTSRAYPVPIAKRYGAEDLEHVR
ncbi:MAG TPA: hypothetical protein VGE07_25405 [Herpetosiphonaceae bacterium]